VVFRCTSCESVGFGGGIVGAQAAKMAAGFGANVIILDVNLNRLRYLADVMPQMWLPLFQ
jgi:alanine dehydrogenase